MSQDALTQAKELLRRNGYVVIPRDRHLVLTSQAVLRPDYIPNDQGYIDHVWGTLAHSIGPKIMADRACIRQDRTIEDCVTGTERALRLAVAVVMPRADDDKR